MKTLKPLLAASVLLISATAANAAHFEQNNIETVRAEMNRTFAEAHLQGLNELTDDFRAYSPNFGDSYASASHRDDSRYTSLSVNVISSDSDVRHDADI